MAAAYPETTGGPPVRDLPIRTVVEMQTGEGKTLVATMPVARAALAGDGVHVLATSDYLARRDAEWMGLIYRALGLGYVAELREGNYLVGLAGEDPLTAFRVATTEAFHRLRDDVDAASLATLGDLVAQVERGTTTRRRRDRRGRALPPKDRMPSTSTAAARTPRDPRVEWRPRLILRQEKPRK